MFFLHECDSKAFRDCGSIEVVKLKMMVLCGCCLSNNKTVDMLTLQMELEMKMKTKMKMRCVSDHLRFVHFVYTIEICVHKTMKAFSSVSTIRLTDALNFGAVFCGCYYCWFVICSKDLTRNGCFVHCNYLHHSFCLISHMRDVLIIILCTQSHIRI